MNNLTKSIVKFVINNFIPKRNKGRKLKCNIDHYIDTIFYVLKTGIRWSDIQSNLHWTTYHKKFTLFSKYRVFEHSHWILLKFLERSKFFKDHSLLKDLFIDSTMIKNIQGTEFLGKNHYDRKRNGNKISIVVTNNGIPLAIKLDKASTHDVTAVEEIIDQIDIKIVHSRLIGDKGYVNQNLKQKLKQKKIHLVYPYRKNQSTKNTAEELKLLKQRHIVENVFAWIKKYRRIQLRYDKKKENFLQFCYFCIVDITCKKIS